MPSYRQYDNGNGFIADRESNGKLNGMSRIGHCAKENLLLLY